MAVSLSFLTSTVSWPRRSALSMNSRQHSQAASGSDFNGGSSLAGRYLGFELSGEHYGMTILSVREIIALQEITPIAGAPRYVEGVINLRGRIIPIVTLGALLSLGEGERSARTCIIVTEIESGDGELTLVGCIVETVSEVMQISTDQVEPPPQLGPGIDLGSLLGLAKIGNPTKIVSLLDIHRVLGSISSLSFA